MAQHIHTPRPTSGQEAPARDRAAKVVLMGFAGPMLLGCLITSTSGDDEGDLFGFGPPSANNTSPAGFNTDDEDEEWREESEERRMERDDPTSTEFRGSFSLNLTGERTTTLDATELGEATYQFVEEDLFGTPAHCQFTLADRAPDARGQQGYMILQYFSVNNCLINTGTYDIASSWEEIPDGEDGLVVKTLQLNIESDTAVSYRTYTDPLGSVTLQKSGPRIAGSVDLDFGQRAVDDGAPEDITLRVIGDFEAVTKPE